MSITSLGNPQKDLVFGILHEQFNLSNYISKNDIIFEYVSETLERKYCIPLKLDFTVREHPQEAIQGVFKQFAKDLEQSNLVRGMMRERDNQISELQKQVEELQSQVDDMKKYKNYYDVAMKLNHGDKNGNA